MLPGLLLGLCPFTKAGCVALLLPSTEYHHEYLKNCNASVAVKTNIDLPSTHITLNYNFTSQHGGSS